MNWYKYFAGSDWVKVEGRIIKFSSQWNEEDYPNFTFKYEYNFEGQTFTSKDIRLCTFKDDEDGRGMFNRLNKDFKEGDPIKVFVDPEEPSSAYIIREITSGMIIYPILFLFVLGAMYLNYKKHGSIYDEEEV